MPVPRQYIIRGPALIQAGAGPVTLYSKEDITVTSNTKTVENANDALGKIDELLNDADVSIGFTPSSQVTNAILAYLYPYFQAQFYPGQSIFGANADVPIVIWGRNNFKYTFPNTGVEAQPDLNAGGGRNPFGAMKVRAIRPNNTSWSGGNIVNIGQAAYPGDATYNGANNIIVPFTGLWAPGAVPTFNINASTEANPAVIQTTAAHSFIVGDRVTIAGAQDPNLNITGYVATVPDNTHLTINTLAGTAVAGSLAGDEAGTITRANGFDAAFPTESGFTLSSQLTLNSGKEGETDDSGLIDVTFQKMSVMAKAIVVGVTPQELLAAQGIQGAGAVRYGSLQAIGRNLYLNGNGLYAKLPLAGIKAATPIRASSKQKGVGEITWTSTATITDGALQPLAQVSTDVID
jgi:hypothetical protein